MTSGGGRNPHGPPSRDCDVRGPDVANFSPLGRPKGALRPLSLPGVCQTALQDLHRHHTPTRENFPGLVRTDGIRYLPLTHGFVGRIYMLGCGPAMAPGPSCLATSAEHGEPCILDRLLKYVIQSLFVVRVLIHTYTTNLPKTRTSADVMVYPALLLPGTLVGPDSAMHGRPERTVSRFLQEPGTERTSQLPRVLGLCSICPRVPSRHKPIVTESATRAPAPKLVHPMPRDVPRTQ